MSDLSDCQTIPDSALGPDTEKSEHRRSKASPKEQATACWMTTGDDIMIVWASPEDNGGTTRVATRDACGSKVVYYVEILHILFMLMEYNFNCKSTVNS